MNLVKVLTLAFTITAASSSAQAACLSAVDALLRTDVIPNTSSKGVVYGFKVISVPECKENLLKAEDIIVSLNGKSVAKSTSMLDAFQSVRAGGKIEILAERAGKEVKISIKK